MLRDKSQALVLVTKDPIDRCTVRASSKLKAYRAVWREANSNRFQLSVREASPKNGGFALTGALR
jgi:hypothetical protein